MALHDAYARRTPYELALPSAGFADERFQKVVEEATGQGFVEHLSDPTAFALLGEVGAIMQEIRGPDDPPEVVRELGGLLFHAFQFWRAGHPLFLVGVPAAREAVAQEGWPVDHGGILGEGGAAYLQLPQHLFWLPGEAGPQSLDGVFVSWSSDTVHALAIGLLLSAAPAASGEAAPAAGTGVVVLELPPVPVAEFPVLMQANHRDRVDDFSTTMPGADLDGLYGVESAGEVFKLVGALLPRLSGASDPEGPPKKPEGPSASRLHFRRIGPSGG